MHIDGVLGLSPVSDHFKLMPNRNGKEKSVYFFYYDTPKIESDKLNRIGEISFSCRAPKKQGKKVKFLWLQSA